MLARACLDGLDLVAGELALEVAAVERADEVAVADAIDLDLDLGGVDGDDGDALLAAARQHVALAGEAHERLAVGHVDGDGDALLQALLDVGGKPGAELDLVALAVREAIDAELLAVGRNGLRVLAVDGNELREVDLLVREVLGELQAQARGGGLRFGLVVDHAEAVLGAQLLVGSAHLAVVGEREARLQSIDRGAPERAALERVAEHGERTRLVAVVLRSAVGDVGGAGGVHRQVVALVAFLGINVDGEERAREPDPGVDVLAVGDDCGGEVARSPARIGAKPFLSGLAQLWRLFAGGLPVGLEVGLVTLAVLLDPLMQEGMRLRGVLGGRRSQGKDEHECEESVREVPHGFATLGGRMPGQPGSVVSEGGMSP